MYLPCSMHPSLSFLALYISVLSPVHCTFPMSHCSLPFAHFLCLIFSSLSPLTLSSCIFIPSLCRPYLVIPYFPYNLFPIIQITLILTTPCTCINTTCCCSLSLIINFDTPCPSSALPINLVPLPSTHLTPFIDVCNVPDHLCSLL